MPATVPEMDAAKLQSIQIPDEQRRRSHGAFWLIILLVLGVTAVALYFARPWAPDERESPAAAKAEPSKSAEAAPSPLPAGKAADVAFTVSGNYRRRQIGCIPDEYCRRNLRIAR